jgi:hypothetical protein
MSLLTHPLLFWSACLLLVDVLLWHLAPFAQRLPRVSLRLVLFMVYSALIFNGGISPLQAQSWPAATGRHRAGDYLVDLRRPSADRIARPDPDAAHRP